MKRGQFEVQFNWIFILIVGAIILLFFGSIVVKQKEVSEKKISVDVIKTLESIIAGSSLSENTFNVLDIPETELEFICDEDGTSFYRIKDTGISVDSDITPLFSPAETTSSTLYTWTISFESPFKVVDALTITASDIKYFFITNDDNWRASVERQLPSKMNYEFVNSQSEINPAGYDRIRLIFKGAAPSMTPNLNSLPDSSLTALEVSGNELIFYRKDGSSLMEEGRAPLISSFTSKDLFLLTSFFSENSVSYKCNLKKLFKKGEIISSIYKRRAEEILSGDCRAMVDMDLFEEEVSKFGKCKDNIDKRCSDIYTHASEIARFNENLQEASCPLIY